MVKKEVLKESSSVYTSVDLSVLNEEKLRELKEEIQDRLDFIRGQKEIKNKEVHSQEEFEKFVEECKLN